MQRDHSCNTPSSILRIVDNSSIANDRSLNAGYSNKQTIVRDSLIVAGVAFLAIFAAAVVVYKRCKQRYECDTYIFYHDQTCLENLNCKALFNSYHCRLKFCIAMWIRCYVVILWGHHGVQPPPPSFLLHLLWLYITVNILCT